MLGSPQWKPYLDILLADPVVRTAGIFGKDGAIWAAQDDLAMNAGEIRDLVAGFIDPAKLSQLGILVVGVKYLYTGTLESGQGGQRVISGRKAGASVLATPTGRGLIVVLTREGSNPANASKHLLVAADLIKKGI